MSFKLQAFKYSIVCQRRLIYFQLHCAECRLGGVHYCITIIFPYSCTSETCALCHSENLETLNLGFFLSVN